MNKHLFFLTKRTLHFLLILFVSSSLYATSEVELDIHAVGQGNCITIKVPKPDPTGKEKYEYMIVDLGSSSYSNEKEIKKIWIAKTQELQQNQSAIIKKLKDLDLNPSTPQSDEKKTIQPRQVKNATKEEKIRPKLTHKLIRWLYGEEAGESVKEALKDKRLKSEKIIKTIVITHPDGDHNNLLTYFLESGVGEKITIENVILGGLPKRYEKGFKKIFDNLLQQKPFPVKIYFPATGQYYESRKDFFDEVPAVAPHFYHLSPKQIQEKEAENKLKTAMLEFLKAQQFPSLDQAHKLLNEKISDVEQKTFKAFADAFSFQNKEFKLFCLCANALHTDGFEGRSVRSADDAPAFGMVHDLEESESKREHLYRIYNNADSLVLKFEYFGKSAILTGDATGLVTSRIAHSYAKDPAFLHTDVLIAGHHGSYSHGSNNPTWLSQTQPRYILISNGTMYGHPYIESYNAFGDSPCIEKRLDPHYVLLSRRGPRDAYNKTYDAHWTYKGIYSTLSNGNLRVLFPAKMPEEDKDHITPLFKRFGQVKEEAVKKKPKPSTKKDTKNVKPKATLKPSQTESKTANDVIKGVKITLYKNAEKAQKEAKEQDLSGDEETDIYPQVEEEDTVSREEIVSPVKPPSFDKEEQ